MGQTSVTLPCVLTLCTKGDLVKPVLSEIEAPLHQLTVSCKWALKDNKGHAMWAVASVRH